MLVDNALMWALLSGLGVGVSALYLVATPESQSRVVRLWSRTRRRSLIVMVRRSGRRVRQSAHESRVRSLDHVEAALTALRAALMPHLQRKSPPGNAYGHATATALETVAPTFAPPHGMMRDSSYDEELLRLREPEPPYDPARRPDKTDAPSDPEF